MSWLVLISSAFAVDADTYEPAGSTFDGLGGLQVESPEMGTPNDWYLGLQLVYANNPVVLISDGESSPYVNGHFATRLGGGYTIGRALRLDLDLPFYPMIAAEPGGFEGAALGDIRLGAQLPVLRFDDSPVAVSFKPFVSLPTGNADSYTSLGGFAAGVSGSAGAKLGDKLFVNGTVGTTLAPATVFGSQTFGSTFSYGAGAGYWVTPTLVTGLELTGDVSLAGLVGEERKNPLEAHAYGTLAVDPGLVATLGVGTGVIGGLGAPDFRVIAGIGWHSAPPADKDKDGITDDLDGCVTEPEDVDTFQDADGCPDPDNDGDSIADAADACPLQAEDVDTFEDTNGCPDPDNDADGVVDTEDTCPLEKGTAATAGCPDSDGDAIADREDSCPAEPGPKGTKGCPDGDNDLVEDKRDKCPTVAKDPRENPATSDGCPKKVVVTAESIELNETVFFDVNKTTIKSVSFPLLDEVAKVLNENPQIKKLEIGGHTDADGNDAKNLKLSQGRAEAVVKYLVEKGKVDASRLSAQGYGETKPIADNTSAEGKAKNRRVELKIK